MRFGRFLVLIVAVALSACSPNRGGMTDAFLDRSLYKAETKAERLLRYYEIQALLVRYAALFGGTKTERNAIAAANVVATSRMREAFTCLHLGSINADSKDIPKDMTRPSLRGTNYCSFFDTRMLSYESALLNLLRMATGYDQQVSEIKMMMAGWSTMDVLKMGMNLLTLAERVARDAHVLDAFMADARELQFLIWQEGLVGPETVDANRRYEGIHPERDPVEIVERGLRAHDVGPVRPTVLVWHLREVSAFLRDSCRELNDDAEMSDFNKMRCTNNLPFLDVPAARLDAPVASTSKPDAVKEAAKVAAKSSADDSEPTVVRPLPESAR